MVRTQSNAALIVRALFLIPAERFAASFCRCFVEANNREQPAHRLDTHGGSASTLVRDHFDVTAGLAESAGVRDVMNAVVGVAVVGQHAECLVPPSIAHPLHMCCKRLALSF